MMVPDLDFLSSSAALAAMGYKWTRARTKARDVEPRFALPRASRIRDRLVSRPQGQRNIHVHSGRRGLHGADGFAGPHLAFWLASKSTRIAQPEQNFVSDERRAGREHP